MLCTGRRIPGLEKLTISIRRWPMIGDTLTLVCDCATKDALVCKEHPDCRPSYCKMRMFDPQITVREIPKPTCLHDFLDTRNTLTLEAHWALGVRVRCACCSQVREIMDWIKTTQAKTGAKSCAL